MSAFPPLAIAGHPPSCGALGMPNVSVNHRRTIGWKARSAPLDALDCFGPRRDVATSALRDRAAGRDSAFVSGTPRPTNGQPRSGRLVDRPANRLQDNEIGLGPHGTKLVFTGGNHLHALHSFLASARSQPSVIQDIRYAVRKLSRTPGFTAIAAFTLALAIGATTAIFSVIDGVLLKPLPFRDPERVVRVTNIRDGNRLPSSTPDFNDFRAQAKSFSSMAGIDNQAMNLTGGSDPERVSAARVGASFWTLLGVTPTVGRGFAPNEDTPAAGRSVVLSDGLWKRRFGADRRIVGRTIALDGNTYTVIGVAPPRFAFPDRPDLWIPLVFGPDDLDPSNRGSHWMGIIARLSPNVTNAQATSEMVALTRRLEQQYPESNTGLSAAVIPMQEYLVGDVRPALYVMLGAVAFVLLIACANVANLLLVRAASRESEMAVRTALGAGSWRIVRQLVIESVLLAVIGGVFGTMLALWGVDLLLALAPEGLPRIDEVTVNASVLLFTAGVTALTGVLFGIFPALHTARANVSGMLKEGMRGSSGGVASRRARNTLVMAEMALAVVLLVGAGLLIRSFSKLLAVDPGFRPERVVTFSIAAPDTKYGKYPQRRALVADLIERMKRIPGSQSAAVVTGLPLSNMMMRTVAHIEGTPQERPSERKITDIAMVTPGYFATMGIPMVSGRDFSDRDGSGAPVVAIVNQEFVKRYFPNENPLGKRIRLGWEQDTSATGGNMTLGGEIVGVVGNVKRRGLSQEVYPETYASFMQPTFSNFNVVVRSTADPSTVMAAIRAQVREADRDLPLSELRQLKELVSASVSRPRFYTTVLGVFAAIALVLAAVGIYGVISYAVSLRTRELGIRIALGASGRQVSRLVLQQGVGLALAGVAIGGAGSYWLTRLLGKLLFGVSAKDPLTFVGVAALLTAIAAVASFVPARRAARVDPLLAMRE
jgi:putative ABC transport system permease protein